MSKKGTGYRMVPPSNWAPNFKAGWKAASAKGRIATLPEHAALRITAPRPHTPGKPWECYLDGKSPLWQSWLMNSSCLLIGAERGQTTVVTIVHGLEPEFGETTADRWCVFSPQTWERVLEETPEERKLSFEELRKIGRTEHDHGWFRRSDLLQNRFAAMIFGQALETYTEAHRAMTAEFMYHVVGYGFGCSHMFDPDAPQNRRIIDDPPIIDLDYEMSNRLPLPPRRGAIGRYLCLNNVMTMYCPEFRPHGKTRLCQVNLVKPTDNCRFLVIE